MIVWTPKGEESPKKNIVNVSPVGPPLKRDDLIIGNVVPGKTCVYPFIPENADYDIVFFKQRYKVMFIPYEQDAWREFLEYLETFVDESLDQDFKVSLDTPWKADYVLRFLKKKFPARLNVTKVKISQNEVLYGNFPKKVLRYGLHNWGQKSFIMALWNLSLGKLENLEIFLINRPLDNLILHLENPNVAFEYIANERDLKIHHPLMPRLEDGTFKITLNGQDKIIRDPTKSFDIEVYPIIVKRNDRAAIKGFRILGSHIASFLRFYMLETKRILKSIKIWARDWKNTRIDVNKITDVPQTRDKEFREAVILFETEYTLDIPLTKLKYPVNLSYPTFDSLDIQLNKDLIDFIKSFDINNPKNYSSRYSHILPKVRGNWDLAVKVSRALKTKISRKVALHTINHTIISLLRFYGYIACEVLENPEELYVDARINHVEKNPESLFEIAYALLKSCTCDEVCEGCAYNPSCPHENRYLDRIIALKALHTLFKE